MNMTIGGEEFKITYGADALFCRECVEKTLNLFIEHEKKDKTKPIAEQFSTILTDIPQTTLSIFYAGLLEHHGKNITNKSAAKKLLKQYFKENKQKTFLDMLTKLLEQMHEDGFITLLGLGTILSNMTQTE